MQSRMITFIHVKHTLPANLRKVLRSSRFVFLIFSEDLAYRYGALFLKEYCASLSKKKPVRPIIFTKNSLGLVWEALSQGIDIFCVNTTRSFQIPKKSFYRSFLSCYIQQWITLTWQEKTLMLLRIQNYD